MFQKKNKIRSGFSNTRSGFTLAEMILVVALTLFLLTVTMQGLVNSASQFTFVNASEKIQEMIRNARSLAISGKAQLDYVDFDKDGCVDDSSLNTAPCSASTPPDYVTPAHYGVNFSSTGGSNPVYTAVLFADNHSNTPGNEGKYISGSGVTDYRAGKDIILETYQLPAGINLIFPGVGATASSATIFFSPIFADISFDPPLTTGPTGDDPFFKFGASQPQAPGGLRKRCNAIHKLAGISEPMTVTPTANPLACP